MLIQGKPSLFSLAGTKLSRNAKTVTILGVMHRRDTGFLEGVIVKKSSLMNFSRDQVCGYVISSIA